MFWYEYLFIRLILTPLLVPLFRFTLYAFFLNARLFQLVHYGSDGLKIIKSMYWISSLSKMEILLIYRRTSQKVIFNFRGEGEGGDSGQFQITCSKAKRKTLRVLKDPRAQKMPQVPNLGLKWSLGPEVSILYRFKIWALNQESWVWTLKWVYFLRTESWALKWVN